jgi:probable dihydroxyacetone kinase regulator
MPEANITKRALGASLKTLMAATSFHKISVGDICEQCGMHRKSFYYHFQDKYDLLGWVFYSEFMQLVDESRGQNAWGFLDALCRYFLENRAFYLNAFSIEGQNAFSDTFNETLADLLKAYLQREIADDDFRDFYCAFYSDAFRCAIIRWLKSDGGLSSEAFVTLCRRSVRGIDPSARALGSLIRPENGR